MAVVVGIDVAKETHWVEIKVAESVKVVTSLPVENTPTAIAELIVQIRAAEDEHGPARVGLDLLGGVATLLEAMLLEAGLTVLHVPGVTVSEARRGTVGGEQKSDPKDARVIADQLRMREDFRELPGCVRTMSSCGYWSGGVVRSSPIRPGAPRGCGSCWPPSTHS